MVKIFSSSRVPVESDNLKSDMTITKRRSARLAGYFQPYEPILQKPSKKQNAMKQVCIKWK